MFLLDSRIDQIPENPFPDIEGTKRFGEDDNAFSAALLLSDDRDQPVIVADKGFHDFGFAGGIEIVDQSLSRNFFVFIK